MSSSWWSVHRRHDGHGEQTGSGRPAKRLSAAGAFRRGLLGDVLNPKVGLFYMTVFPQFIEPQDPLVAAAAVLLLAHAAVLLTWYPAVSAVVLRAGRYVKPQVKVLLERVMGSVLIALGVRLAIAPR